MRITVRTLTSLRSCEPQTPVARNKPLRDAMTYGAPVLFPSSLDGMPCPSNKDPRRVCKRCSPCKERENRPQTRVGAGAAREGDKHLGCAAQHSSEDTRRGARLLRRTRVLTTKLHASLRECSATPARPVPFREKSHLSRAPHFRPSRCSVSAIYPPFVRTQGTKPSLPSPGLSPRTHY